MTNLRIGHGYDVHRLVEGRPLILGGESIDFDRGLEGWSDADVVLHALCDALLGAAGLGDIGEHFPPGDPRYEGAESVELLRTVVDTLREQRFRVVNCDVTVIAEAPRMSSYKSSIRRRLSSLLGVDIEAVGFKATTHEGLGSLGRGEGIAAHAVVLIEGEAG